MSTLPLIGPGISTWCSFRALPSLVEAAEISTHCLFSLATLEVAFSPATINYALTEQEHALVWRWAIIGPESMVLDEGWEPTQRQAQVAAEAMLRSVAA